MKLWQKDTSTNEKIDHFTVGNDRTYDLAFAPTTASLLKLTQKCSVRLEC